MNFDNALASLFTRVETAAEKGDDVTGLPTGFRDFDRFTSGLHSTEMTVVTGVAWAGHRDLMMSMAHYQAAELEAPVVWAGLVESARRFSEAIVASEAMIDVDRLARGKLKENEWRKLGEALHKLADKPLALISRTDLTLDDITHACVEHEAQVLYIDSFSALLENERSPDAARWDAAAQLLWELRRTAEAHDLHIVVGNTLPSKGINARMDRRPGHEDLTETSAWASYAHTIMSLYRDEIYYENTPDRGIAEGRVERFIHPQSGVVKLAYLGHVRKFANLALRGPVPPPDGPPP